MATEATPPAQKRSYKKTLNLPKTAFPMKANLVQNEPASVNRWEADDLYQKLRHQARERNAPPFVAHDGPPYANGDIHLGHLLNKVLKDLVVRSRWMLGYDCPYTPGWDCHGLPIEHRVLSEMSEAERAEASVMKIRNKSKRYAERHVVSQTQQMQRLLTLADYPHPYLTMDPMYEAGVLEVFAGLLEAGLVYRDLKPVHWSIENRTALAEAELEYEDREDTAVHVLFPTVDDPDTAFMIWTTTPWTLPANLAVAVHPRMTYGLYDLPEGFAVRRAWLATDLAAGVLNAEADAGEPAPVPQATATGRELVGRTYRHPFLERTGAVLEAEYVTAEDGTGLVHTAPGHGVEDYQSGLANGLEVYCPVQADGTYDHTVPDWLAGRSIWEGNQAVEQRLRAEGALFRSRRFTHSYPHDWRGKTPVIFRATEQWFIGVDRPIAGAADGAAAGLRERALAAIESVDFVPAWGRNRMRGMLESRPDWCVSRQRSWGLPIPAFFSADGEPLLTPASVRAVAAVVAERGADAWFLLDPVDLLAGYDPVEDPDAPGWAGGFGMAELTKGGDTFDVWFESGSSWHAVLRDGWRSRQSPAAVGRGDGLGAYPADLYLEGSDQHRGWFQHSLLPALAITGEAPFKAVLTHGFMVDRDGRKLSKSEGNAIRVADLMQRHGADVCRWWVSTLNVENDIKADAAFFDTAGEQYRKVRNTLRFLLSNLDDADARALQGVADGCGSHTLDAWMLGELETLRNEVAEAFEAFRFKSASEALFHFCNQTLSSVYLVAVKDRLYCDRPDSGRRRQTQAVLHRVADVLCRLLAPILPHTADEAWRVLHGDQSCVHLEVLRPDGQAGAPEVSADWRVLMQARDGWMRGIEQARTELGLKDPLTLGLVVPDPDGVLANFAATDLADLCGVSRFEIGDAFEVVSLAHEPRCERSWKRDGTVRQRSDGGLLSDRDAAAIGV